MKNKYAREFTAMLDKWHSIREPWDTELDALIHEQYAEVMRNPRQEVNWQLTYFSPSSANAAKRELYHKLRGDKKDTQPQQPHQGRWQRIGTAIGDILQRDLLFIEKHWEKTFGEAAPFTVERTEEGFPMWEEFIHGMHFVEHRGHQFHLLGTPDGIIRHKDGKRMGLEIKSKQTTPAQTSLFSMKGPKEDHVRQVICYAIMHNLDKYLIIYVNAAKKGWVLSEEDYEKTPDIRVFEVDITEEMKNDVLDYFADVIDDVVNQTPPPMDWEKWNFCDFKTAIAQSMTDEEFAEMRQIVQNVMRSTMPQWMKDGYFNAYEFVKAIREGGAS